MDNSVSVNKYITSTRKGRKIVNIENTHVVVQYKILASEKNTVSRGFLNVTFGYCGLRLSFLDRGEKHQEKEEKLRNGGTNHWLRSFSPSVQRPYPPICTNIRFSIKS